MGHFDPPQIQPFSFYPSNLVNSAEHQVMNN